MFEPGEKAKVVFSILDSGIGIKVKDQLRLFKMFSSINSNGLNAQGIGLGLYIS